MQITGRDLQCRILEVGKHLSGNLKTNIHDVSFEYQKEGRNCLTNKNNKRLFRMGT